MRIAAIDAWSGASGDMFLGALVDAGVDPGRIRSGLAGLPGGWDLRSEVTTRAGLSGTAVTVAFGESHTHRDLSGILEIIAGAGLPPAVAGRSARAFELLAAAEARVHGIPVQEVHFHEVGAVDAMVDIAGTFLGFAELGVESVWCPAAATGWGTVSCAHGELPVPAPATAVLVEGIPVVSGPGPGELLTPTGAAILRVLVTHWSPPPPAVWRMSGCGAGKADPETPNLLRIRVGETASGEAGSEILLELATVIDDMDPRLFPQLQEAVMKAGALDCYALQGIGRKGRPALEAVVLCAASAREGVEKAVFHNSTTLGIRARLVERISLDRSIRTVTTPWGDVRIKEAYYQGRLCSATPEYSDCMEIARAAGVPVRVVLDSARAQVSRERQDGRERDA
jgi:hypothetical protein